MKAIIFGGSGYLGTHICNEFLKRNYEVHAVDIKEPSNKKVIFHLLDISNFTAMQEILAGIAKDSIIINAAIIQIPLINENPELAWKVNIKGMKNICELALKYKAKKFIQISTWHVYGEGPYKEKEIDEKYGYHLYDVSERARFYATHKVIQECITYHYKNLGLDTIIVRPATILGEGMPEKTAANMFIKNGFEGKPLTPFDDSQYRPMIYVDVNDLVNLIAYCGENKINYNEIHIGNKPITVIELARTVQEILKEKGVNATIEVLKGKGNERIFTEKDKQYCNMNISRYSSLNLKQLTPPKESIKRIIENYKQ